MSGNKDKTISRRGPNRNAVDLDANCRYNLTRTKTETYERTKTTTEKYKITESAPKPSGKDVKVATSHRHSSLPQPSSSKGAPRKPFSPPGSTKELFVRLIAQFLDRQNKDHHITGYTAWKELVSLVFNIRHNYNYARLLGARQASQLVSELETVLHEAERRSNLWDSFERLCTDSRGVEDVKWVRNSYLESWGKTVRKWQSRLHMVKIERLRKEEKERLRKADREKEKAREALKKLEKQKLRQEEKDRTKKARFLGSFS